MPGTLSQILNECVPFEEDKAIKQQRPSPLHIIYKGGEITRKEAAEILDLGERQTRRILLLLTKEEVLISESLRSPLQLNFPARLAGQWLPGLFPEPSTG